MARQQKRDKNVILTRTEKWNLHLSTDTQHLVLQISDALREYYNWALEKEKRAHDTWQAAIKAAPETKPNEKRFLSEIDLYNLWKSVRADDAKHGLFRARVPANWVLETFKSAVGAYKSFFTLIKNGDPDARTPRERLEWCFQVIPGCSAFSVKGGKIVLAPEIFGRETLSFLVPPKYQASMLGRSVRTAKFIISRDERDLRRPGRYSISVSYEIQRPEQKEFVPEKAVYVALGASSIGIVSPKGEEVIELWRPDKSWKPLVDAVDVSLAARPTDPAYRPIQKGSNRWRKLTGKKGKMLRIMARQQTQDRREVVSYVIERVVAGIIRGHGVHFVVTDLVVRSKEGKLADAKRHERGGPLGLNWSAQNTGAIGYLVEWLEAKVPEYGGTVRKHKLPYDMLPKDLAKGREGKIPLAKALREDFLRSLHSQA